jgi:hypothetical protein
MTTWTKTFVFWILVIALAGPAGLAAAAGPFDGSRPLLCAVTTVMECDASGQCERQIADGVNSPKFIRVDVAGKTVSGGSKSSQLKNMSHVDGELVLQGSENGRGWSATIDEESGRMAAAIVDNDYTFSIFGACTIP